MTLWKKLALNTYYRGTFPARMLRNWRLARMGRAPIVIVTYHRVARDAMTPWTTHIDDFICGIAWLQRNFDLISLDDARRRLLSPEIHRPAVSITFDDGYAENFDRAVPLLLEKKIPFTYFVTTDAVLRGKFFPHDRAAGYRFAPNRVAHLRELIAAGVEIGNHTRSHADLGSMHDEVRLHHETITAGVELEDALGIGMRHFAFPFGQHKNLNRRVFEMASDAGYEAAVSAYGGYQFAGDDAFHLQRICVDGPVVRLKNWATLDPYKQLKIRRYEYGSPTHTEMAEEIAG